MSNSSGNEIKLGSVVYVGLFQGTTRKIMAKYKAKVISVKDDVFYIQENTDNGIVSRINKKDMKGDTKEWVWQTMVFTSLNDMVVYEEMVRLADEAIQFFKGKSKESLGLDLEFLRVLSYKIKETNKSNSGE